MKSADSDCVLRDVVNESDKAAMREGHAIKIEVVAPGCRRCQHLKRNLRMALEGLGLVADVTYVSDPCELARRRVFFTPVLIIEGETKSIGGVPNVEEIQSWLEELRTASAERSSGRREQ